MRPSALSSACRGARPNARFHPIQEFWLVLRTGHNKGREGDFTLFDPRKALKADCGLSRRQGLRPELRGLPKLKSSPRSRFQARGCAKR